MKLKKILFVVAVFIFQILSAQSDQAANPLLDKIDNYFALNRENIHLSLNKSTFLTNETIWFKGYVIEKKSGLLFPKTANSIVHLLDASGTILQSKLCYTERGVFGGSIALDAKIKSGNYYLRVFTNYMNNFSEDESSTYKIKIYNPAEQNFAESTTCDLSSLSVKTMPESGVFLNGISNVVGVHIADCRGVTTKIENGRVLNQAGQEITNFSINSQGFGRFEILETKLETYKIMFDAGGKSYEQKLPQPVATGLVLSANNYSFATKTYLSIKTNSTSAKQYANKNGSLLILNNGKTSLVPIKFTTEQETKIVLDNSTFFEGSNVVFLLDENNNKFAERNIFIAPIKKYVDLKILKENSSKVSFKGSSDMKLANLSLSILPFSTKCIDNHNNVLNEFYIKKSFGSALKNPQYYFENLSADKKYELDIELFFKKSTYKFEDITAVAPSEKFAFDIGLNFTGTANIDARNHKDHTVRMSAVFAGIDIKNKLNDKNEFAFDNVFAQDSLKIYFELFDKDNNRKTLKMVTQPVNANRKFMKPLVGFSQNCPTVVSQNAIAMTFPKIDDAINLKEIEIKNKADKLKNELKFGNAMSKGYKITDDMCKLYFDIYSFLQANGFYITREMGQVLITPVGGGLGIGATQGSPQILVDGMLELEQNNLDIYPFCDIDEIYINRRGMGGGPGSENGVISIYLKKYTDRKPDNSTMKSEAFVVKNGFTVIKPFKNPAYTSISAPEFLQFGTIGWFAEAETDKDGDFQFVMPALNQKTFKVLIEGIDAEGHMISTVQDIKIQ